MIIPDRVIICKKTIDVKVFPHGFIQSGYVYSGLFRSAFMDILLFRTASFVDVLANKEKAVTASIEELLETFYHELWHAICSTGGYEKSETGMVNTEHNCELFGNIALSLGDDNNLINIFNEFKSIVTNIDEQDYRKLEYVVKHTKFDFDKFPPIDEDSEIVDDTNIAD